MRYTLSKQTKSGQKPVYKVNNIVSSQAYYDYLLDHSVIQDSFMRTYSGDSVIDSVLIRLD